MGNFSVDSLQAAKRLINMDANGELDQVTNKLKKSGKMQYDSEGQVMVEHTNKTLAEPNMSTLQMKNIKSKLPKEIIQSFKNTPSFSSDGVSLMESSSILDVMNSLSKGQLMEEMKKDEEIIQEQPTVQSRTPNNTSIDYNAIQAIVESTIKRYMSSLKKSLLTESKSNNATLQAMKIGDTFSFIDKSGNLYEAKLKFVKNINTK